MNSIQTLVMPNLTFNAPQEMYVRLWTDKVRSDFIQKKIIFKDNGRVSFDTYFNSVSVGVWKYNCPSIENLSLKLYGNGKFVLRFGLHRIGHAHKWLSDHIIELVDEIPSLIDVQAWKNLEGGMLYFHLEAIGNAELKNGAWVTHVEPSRDVKLGIVITHFNRKKYVLPAIERIRTELLNDFIYAQKIELVVVDNSENITEDEALGVTVLPNKNLGGAGGFTRGLLHLKDHAFTHCLFMDDDASCEIESLKRAYNLLQYASDEKLAVAGALLREIEPNRLFEKGALFKEYCIPLKSEMDMTVIADLLYAELIDRTPDYGGWWFFAFKIDKISELAFPFFVRGDDSRFSMMNQFHIITQNGIACWGDDFALKSGVIPSYLDARYHILHTMNIRNSNFRTIKKIAYHFVVKQLFSYNYASARAGRMALQHVMKGPQFFEEHMDMVGIRKEISEFASCEKMIPIERRFWSIDYGKPRESRLKMIFRKISLNGFLIPFVFFKKNTLFQHKGFVANLKEIFLYKTVIYEYEPSSNGYVGLGYEAVHDKMLFFKEYWLYLKTMWKFKRNYQKLQQEYKKAFPEMTSENFWRSVYSDM